LDVEDAEKDLADSKTKFQEAKQDEIKAKRAELDATSRLDLMKQVKKGAEEEERVKRERGDLEGKDNFGGYTIGQLWLSVISLMITAE
jgi:hypothetical protein